MFWLFLFFLLRVPSSYRVAVGERLVFDTLLPRQIAARITTSGRGEGGVLFPPFHPFRGVPPVAARTGRFCLEFRFLGFFPCKKVTLHVLPPATVVVGGHSIGVLLQAEGVEVVGYAPLPGPGGEDSSPGRAAGIRPGDVILRIEGTRVRTGAQVAFLVDELGRRGGTLVFEVKRGRRHLTCVVRPRYCPETRRYRVGLYVREGAAGVGTLTFFDPVTRKYGALGHMVTPSAAARGLDLGEGKIVRVSIQGIRQGRQGRIGEKLGTFVAAPPLGGITRNTPYGIFGRLSGEFRNPLFPQPVPVAFASQVREGPARLLTVVSGEKVESFAAVIEAVFPRPRPDGKAFIIRVTDPRLLRVAGGIVQGMSGSPVLQDGRLVGAVTHVFVNDPRRGYGVLAEQMLEEAGLLPQEAGEDSPGFLVFGVLLQEGLQDWPVFSKVRGRIWSGRRRMSVSRFCLDGLIKRKNKPGGERR